MLGGLFKPRLMTRSLVHFRTWIFTIHLFPLWFFCTIYVLTWWYTNDSFVFSSDFFFQNDSFISTICSPKWFIFQSSHLIPHPHDSFSSMWFILYTWYLFSHVIFPQNSFFPMFLFKMIHVHVLFQHNAFVFMWYFSTIHFPRDFFPQHYSFSCNIPR